MSTHTVMVWLHLGHKTAWLGLETDHTLGKILSSLEVKSVQVPATRLPSVAVNLSVCHAQLHASHHVTTTPVAAFWRRRNITPPFQIDKAAHCSLYLAANVPSCLSKSVLCQTSEVKSSYQAAVFDPGG